MQKSKTPKEEVKLTPAEKEILKAQKVVSDDAQKKAAKDVKKQPFILKNILGEEMDPSDYFFPNENDEVVIPPFFNRKCGMPVLDREDLIEVFNKVFKPEDNVLFYKSRNKETYIVIFPLKISTNIGKEFDSAPGDFQAHALSFVKEGSANLDTLKSHLKRIAQFVRYNDR